MRNMVTAADFNIWLAHGAPGSRIVYFQGHLAHDREGTILFSPSIINGHKHEHYVHQFFDPQHTTAIEAYRAYILGKVFLLQERLGPNKFNYIAQKRSTRHGNRHRHPSTSHYGSFGL